ncbi:type II toxin-antitoxin system HipA family toxin [Stigmatella sp. ncwal1]|uniref:Type II toxin-antitoxin system HipA family toxin n=1 Tax=Stigmatella ashevillensis TaxID=2995309 RepID=A0ABT5DFS6_9BACT|nr:type II toxin-antitoxin system HipA family toxin [Stigmatella ashevillena]MDC0712463.1 type II toxin-antitoxin system HipA family toxin [Stigmatella ashevillena]
MLDVFLENRLVGKILREEATSIASFLLDETYAEDAERPVLGQQFEERRHHRFFRQAAHPGQLPTFFANLLPEGALDELIQAQLGTEDAAAKLAFLGEDLPGAVRVRRSGDASVPPPGTKTFDEPPRAPSSATPNLRFSLAGVQLKFSAVRSEDSRFTLPFSGQGGRWILKFGSVVYPELPENEHFTMQWAARCGLTVPHHQLVPVSTIASLDPRFAALGENVFAIERYDRHANGIRIHQEDFAQIRGVPPDLKYQGASLEQLARLVGDLCGPNDLHEFLHRVLFLLLSGNTDGHLKNWSLVYPDGRRARLSPAYDFVCVRQYLPSDQLALPLAKERSPERIEWGHIRRVDKYLKAQGHDVDFEGLAKTFVTKCMDEWAAHRSQVSSTYRGCIEAHLAGLPLLRHKP